MTNLDPKAKPVAPRHKHRATDIVGLPGPDVDTLAALQDVDVSSTPPVDGDTLVWVDADKKWEPGSVAGFDPNEDPVIIGSGATAGGGSTPSSLTGGTAHTVAIGNLATASGTASVAVGKSTSATNSNTLALGNAASATGLSATAVGTSASSSGLSSSALGTGTTASHDGASAVGSDATTTRHDQVMLGTDSGFAEIPGNNNYNGIVFFDPILGVRKIVQVRNGALVVNTAPW